MSRILRLFLSLWMVLFFASGLMAQNVKPADKQVKKDTTIQGRKSFREIFKKYEPTGLRMGADLGGMAVTALDKKRNIFEFEADMDFHAFLLTASIGRGGFMTQTENLDYFNSGNYMRFGVDYNFFAGDAGDNAFFLGARYSRSRFSETVSGNVVYGRDMTTNEAYFFPVTGGNSGLVARWFEITTGMKVRVWNQFFLGYTLKYMLARRVSGGDTFSPYYITGYGHAARTSAYWFNYHLYYRIPFKKKPLNLMN
jgi:hypothetical protein